MFSSAAVTVPARVYIGAAAEGSTPNSEKPRPVQQHRNGAEETDGSPRRSAVPMSNSTNQAPGSKDSRDGNGRPTAPTHGMWGKQGRGYPELKGGKK